MTNDPDRIRADIDQTRNDLSEDVDAVRERIRPGTMARRRTAGNPLAAGVIAFGVGWLASTVIPASRTERRAAAAMKRQASGRTQEASSMAREVADDLREPARESAEAVRSTAQDAVQSVRDETRSS